MQVLSCHSAARLCVRLTMVRGTTWPAPPPPRAATLPHKHTHTHTLTHTLHTSVHPPNFPCPHPAPEPPSLRHPMRLTLKEPDTIHGTWLQYATLPCTATGEGAPCPGSQRAREGCSSPSNAARTLLFPAEHKACGAAVSQGRSATAACAGDRARRRAVAPPGRRQAEALGSMRLQHGLAGGACRAVPHAPSMCGVQRRAEGPRQPPNQPASHSRNPSLAHPATHRIPQRPQSQPAVPAAQRTAGCAAGRAPRCRRHPRKPPQWYRLAWGPPQWYRLTSRSRPERCQLPGEPHLRLGRLPGRPQLGRPQAPPAPPKSGQTSQSQRRPPPLQRRSKHPHPDHPVCALGAAR